MEDDDQKRAGSRRTERRRERARAAKIIKVKEDEQTEKPEAAKIDRPLLMIKPPSEPLVSRGVQICTYRWPGQTEECGAHNTADAKNCYFCGAPLASVFRKVFLEDKAE